MLMLVIYKLKLENNNMISAPNYLDVTSAGGELLPHMEKLHEDGGIDAIVVRGALGRLSSEDLMLLEAGVPAGGWSRSPEAANYGAQILRATISDLDEVKVFLKEIGNIVMPDFSIVKDADVLRLDEVRESGLKSYAHVDLPAGTWREGYDVTRGVNSISIGCGVQSALFLAKRLPSFRRDNDISHEFTLDYLMEPAVKIIEDGDYIHKDGWAIEQHPGDIVIFPQFDRPAIHQVEPEPGRSALVYSTIIQSYYDAYRQSDPQFEIKDPRLASR